MDQLDDYDTFSNAAVKQPDQLYALFKRLCQELSSIDKHLKASNEQIKGLHEINVKNIKHADRSHARMLDAQQRLLQANKELSVLRKEHPGRDGRLLA